MSTIIAHKANKIRQSLVLKNVLLILLLLTFFGLMIFPIKKTQWDFVLFPVLIALVGFNIKILPKTLYAKIILLFVLLVLFSCFFSNFIHHQELYLVVVHSYNFFSLLFFFYLIKSEMSANEAERVLIVMSIICCCCYILQWLIYPTVLFSGAENNVNDENDYYRARIPGSLCCYCLFLYGINKYIISRKVKYFSFVVLGFIPIVIMGFRSLTFLTVIVSFLMIPFVVRRSGKTLFYSLFAAVLSVGAMQTEFVQSKMQEMERRQEFQTFSNEDYIRWHELDYYWNEHFNNPGEKWVGGGIPVDVKTKFRKDVYYHNYTWTDLGLVGLSMVIGIPAVVLLVLIYLICMWNYKDIRFQYIRFTLLIVLLGSLFTTSELYRNGNILLFSLILYIQYKYSKERNFT